MFSLKMSLNNSPDGREYPFFYCPKRLADLGNKKKIGKASGTQV